MRQFVPGFVALSVVALAAAALAPLPATAQERVRVESTVQDVNGDQVTVSDGTSFRIVADTRLVRTIPGTPADLEAGQYVAITARPQPDDTLLASIVSVFPEFQRGLAEGQRPMDEGNLMTNATIDDATIDEVVGAELVVGFSGDSARVRIAPDARVLLRVPATMDDIAAGRLVTANVVDGVAETVNVQ